MKINRGFAAVAAALAVQIAAIGLQHPAQFFQFRLNLFVHTYDSFLCLTC